MTDAIRVAIVDDHLLVRQGLREYLEQFPDIQWVGEAADGVAGLALVQANAVDVLLLDLAMPRMNGLQVLPEIRARYPATQVVVLTGYPESHYGADAKRLGAVAYIPKDCEPFQIVSTVRAVARNAANQTPYL